MNYKNDVTLVIHAKWIENTDKYGWYYTCSNCKEQLPRVQLQPDINSFIDEYESIAPTNYCPNCGAKMDEKEELI